MKEFMFYLPTQIAFGEGIARTLGSELTKRNIKSVLVVTDKGIVESGLLRGIEQSLAASDVAMVLYDGVRGNPQTELVYRGVEAFTKGSCGAMCAVGGGSSIDTAKAIGIILSGGGSVEDYEGFGIVKEPLPFLVAIPTTYGTGSEVSTATIITNEHKHYKMFIGSDLIAPHLALIDPELLTALPFAIAASTGLDALTHAVESFVSKNANPITDALNSHVIQVISEHLSPAATTDHDTEATAQMVVASAMTAMAFNYTALGLVHAIAHSLGGLYDVAHGYANSLILPHVMEFNLPSKPDKFARIATLMGESTEGLTRLEAARLSVDAVRDLAELLNIPQRLRDLGVARDSFDQIAEFALADGNIGFNPRVVTKEDIMGILDEAY